MSLYRSQVAWVEFRRPTTRLHCDLRYRCNWPRHMGERMRMTTSGIKVNKTWLQPGMLGSVTFIDICQWGYTTAKLYACIFVVITLDDSWNEIKMHCGKQDVATQHDFIMKPILFGSIFWSKNTGQPAKQADYPGYDHWHKLPVHWDHFWTLSVGDTKRLELNML